MKMTYKNIKNRLQLKGRQKEVDKVIAKFSSFINGYIFCFPDFNKVIPVPKNVISTYLIPEVRQQYILKGKPVWESWSNANWGTETNAYNCQKENSKTFTFYTDNVVPKIIAIIAAAFPNIEFIYEFADEEKGYNCGCFRFKGGDCQRQYFNDCSKEAYKLAIKLHPHQA